MDWSTATMPEGKLAVARTRGEQVPDGVLVDADGEPSNDPQRLLRRRCAAAVRRPQGLGLSVMIQLVGGALGGTGVFGEKGTAANGSCSIALDPAAFTTDFDDHGRGVRARRWPRTSRRTVRRGPGTGEIERRTRERRRAKGIELPPSTWSELKG